MNFTIGTKSHARFCGVSGVKRAMAAGLAGLALGLVAMPAGAAEAPAPSAPALTYADLADLADPAQAVMQVKVSKQSVVEPARAPGLAAGKARLYVVAKPEGVLAGQASTAKAVKYLVDVPLAANGRAPKLTGKRYIVFARTVAGRPDELQLVAPDAQILADPVNLARLAPLLTELAAPDAPPRISGIRDILSVAGNLAGESETQLFLLSPPNDSILVSVVRRPEAGPTWGVAWSELVDQSGRPPARDTLAWYRLACSLPDRLPARANLASEPDDRARALQDYAFVKQELGACTRTRQ